MSAFLLFSRLLLALVFAVAGVAKLIRSRLTCDMLREFGVPERFVSPSSVALPLGELAIAIALLPLGSAWFGAIAALALLVIFSAAIGISLYFGRRPACHCFGQIDSRPVSVWTMLRNGALIAVAMFIIWQSPKNVGYSAIDWLIDIPPVERATLILATIGICLGGLILFLLFQLTAQNGRLLLEFEALSMRTDRSSALPRPAKNVPASFVGLPVGAPAPKFSLNDVLGQKVSLDSLLRIGQPILLVFTDPNCGPCDALMPTLSQWQQKLSELLLVVVSRGTSEENRIKASQFGLASVLLQKDREVQVDYQALGTPSSVLVMADGNIGSGVAQGRDEIHALLTHIATSESSHSVADRTFKSAAEDARCPKCGQLHGNHRHPSQAENNRTPPVGSPLPDPVLRELAEAGADLLSYQGKPLVLLFWNPDCGYCQSLLPELQKWETNRRFENPELLVISSGSGAPKGNQYLRSKTVRDESFQLGRAFAVQGTPSAIVIGPNGKVATEVAVGGSAVMNLMGWQSPVT
jgi:thiol-disulfide isomerase/thioredoxin